jgi:tetratricopeptide (TPR) repeat protein
MGAAVRGTRRVTAITSVVVCLTGCGVHPRGSMALRIPPHRASEESVLVRSIPGRTTTRELEQIDSGLAAAWRGVQTNPGGASYIRLAEAYLDRRVLDAAFEYFSRALEVNRADAVAYEGRARVWRDWGLRGLALTEAHRAVFLSPRSPSAHNTLGTILQSLNLWTEARTAYERVLELQPDATYALANLCSLAVEQGHPERAAAGCRRALEIGQDVTEAAAIPSRMPSRDASRPRNP